MDNTVDNQTDVLARQLTAPMIAAFGKQKKRFNSQNRDSWNRMNRGHKAVLIERGTAKIFALIARFKV